jgi:protein O-mannosyl-transferase
MHKAQGAVLSKRLKTAMEHKFHNFVPAGLPRSGLVAALFLCLTLLLTYLIYLPGLSGPMILDDYPQLDPILENIGKGSWTGFLLSESGVLGRPVAMASFIFNAVVSERNFWWWKFTNVAIHLLTGALVFVLSTRLLAAEDGRVRRNVHYLALLTAGLWLLHPLQVSTVLYTVQRMTQLSVLFVFAGLLSYTLGREKQLAGQPYGWVGIVLAFVVFFPLAVFSKESGLLFPVLTGLLEVQGRSQCTAGSRLVLYLVPADTRADRSVLADNPFRSTGAARI